jgi:hypothetical protein
MYFPEDRWTPHGEQPAKPEQTGALELEEEPVQVQLLHEVLRGVILGDGLSNRRAVPSPSPVVAQKLQPPPFKENTRPNHRNLGSGHRATTRRL